MTKKNNKIMTLYLPKYSIEQSKIYYLNGHSIKVLDYINRSSIPCDLQAAMLNNNYSDTMRLIRKYNSQSKGYKQVKISYSCDVFASVNQTWHHITDTLACGCYNSIKDIKNIISCKRTTNSESITRGYVKNLEFSYNFNFSGSVISYPSSFASPYLEIRRDLYA